ncbi:DNA mismatch repair protein msh6 [Plakobranchus ocellatus]|uniref:DNA mismatch repair protein n=1 Tax=Plakobranchus ocellatus TaxID=259542 RepID=A0AAV4CZZ5_9GAST|nr:DNA mismatch repair protein msh6 [Plakobranchus ocellatus]
MSKTPKGKQTNTLFSYFQKTPKSEGKEKPKGGGPNDVLSPRRSPNDRDKKSASKKNSTPIKNGEAIEHSEGDLVWSKLEGYPYWPSLVCNHPTEKVHVKGGKSKQVHVQFFDEPPTRAWIKERNIKPFNGSDDEACQRGGQFYTLNAKINRGAKEADKALNMERKDRLSLVVDLLPSSDEEEDTMEDLDPTIFDAEMSDEDVLKENCQSKVKESKESSPRKRKSNSPQKPLQSQRKAAKEATMKNKRRRILIKSESGDEDSEDDFKPGSEEEDDNDDDDSASEIDEDEVSDIEPESEPESPVKDSRKRKAPGGSTPASSKKTTSSSASDKKPASSPSLSISTKSKLSSFSAPENAGEDAGQKDASTYTHVSLDFIQPDRIKDKNRKTKSDPEYNPRTLYVPESFLNKQTPAMRQWWELKSNHFDTILFFKVGKFYELYHMDAVVGVREVGLIFMKGDFAHSGFPEIAYNRYADALVQKGYKVARVEQTETPEMVSDRCKNMARAANKYDKVVKREVCQISTQGTRTYSHLTGDIGDHTSKYILAFCEKQDTQEGSNLYGVCFIDTSIGTFHVGQFEDDRHLSRFRTLIAHYTPVQVLYERGKVSSETWQLINANLTSALKEGLTSGTEFWESGKTLKALAEEAYFKNDEEDVDWPQAIKAMLSDNDTLGLTASESKDLAIRALGAVVWYLQYCLLDHELLSMKKFETYIPMDVSKSRSDQQKAQAVQDIKQRHMVLDGVTMSNLDVVWNSGTQSTEGTLLERLNYCSTAFGKRLFHQWLCSPLCQRQAIYDRLDAVGDLLDAPAVMDECVSIMKKLPDLERLLSRIHAIGLSRKSKNHPDSRAILYEELTYSKRKIEDFLATIEGFKLAVSVTEACKSVAPNFKSKLLQQSVCVQTDDSDNTKSSHFPDISDDLEFFETSFDHKKAKRDGVIVPSKGVDNDYDQAVTDIKDVEARLQAYLDKQKSVLGCRSLVYWGTAKNRFQIEVPENYLKNVPHHYELMSSKKGAKRFRTSDIEEMLSELTDAEDRKDTCLKDIMRRIFYNFDQKHKKWAAVVESLSMLDVLMSLATYSRGGEGDLCRPEFVLPEEDGKPFIEIRDGRHPCVSLTFEGGDFIPNDTVIGTQDDQDEEDCNYSNGQVVLVTGPNMGGKSTLMRQVGLITIMAQMGCYVPAQKCRLTPVDRIFTRLGASDRIMAGESTFFVELSETSSILQHASKHSLVLMDELGRGTATYDGTAIACAVVKELSETIGCRSLFSTHYHSLVGEFKHDKNIRLGHMACMVENDNEEDSSQETITFLYKFVKGACPKSYGFNAARLAHLPEEVIQCAVKKSREFEKSVNSCKHFRSMWASTSAKEVQEVC